MSSLRQSLENSQFLARLFATPVAWYLRLCMATTRWQVEGQDALLADMAKGPVLCVLWHERLMMIAPHWPRTAGTLSCLHNTAPIGRVAGALQACFGLDPFEMSAKRSNLATSRAVLRRTKDGISIGITADGPIGPRHAVMDAPLEWARTLQQPVYVYAFATSRHKQLRTWDRMMIPRLFGKGAAVFAPIHLDLPRKASQAQIAQARDALQAGLHRVTARADYLVGLTND